MDRESLRKKAEQYQILLDDNRLKKIDGMVEFLLLKNQEFNLTAITDPQQIEDRHLIDSLVLASMPQMEGSVADVGSGAGFPGVLIKILKPQIELTLIESVTKKAVFLEQLAERLDLDYRVVNARAEEVSRGPGREGFQIVTARAVASLNTLCEYTMPLVRPGGWFLAMKGSKDELPEAGRAIRALGGEARGTKRYWLPDGSDRAIIEIEKREKTSEKYPRATAAIKKKPL